jgi:hypothetical protein
MFTLCGLNILLRWKVWFWGGEDWSGNVTDRVHWLCPKDILLGGWISLQVPLELLNSHPMVNGPWFRKVHISKSFFPVASYLGSMGPCLIMMVIQELHVLIPHMFIVNLTMPPDFFSPTVPRTTYGSGLFASGMCLPRFVPGIILKCKS